MNAPTGYTLAGAPGSVKEGIKRNLNGVTWKYVDAIVGSGTTTTNVKVYDSNGKLISETNS